MRSGQACCWRCGGLIFGRSDSPVQDECGQFGHVEPLSGFEASVPCDEHITLSKSRGFVKPNWVIEAAI